MAKLLFISDIHLDDNPQHEYRWSCLEDLAHRTKSTDIDVIIIAGDITNAKDGHRAAFLNRVVASLMRVVEVGKPVYVLVGNHDYTDKNTPFFQFLRFVPGVTYMDTPQEIHLPGGYVALALPHGTSWAKDAAWRQQFPLSNSYSFILAHDTFCGATVNGDGKVLDKGPSPTLLDEEVTFGAPVISGDIHQAQVLGNIVYIGSPHPVSFGESRGRYLTYDTETRKFKAIKRGGPQRLVLNYGLSDDGTLDRDIREEQLIEGDHVQVRVSTSQAGLVHYLDTRIQLQKHFQDKGIQVFAFEAKVVGFHSHLAVEAPGETALTDMEVFNRFCDVNEIAGVVRKLGTSYVNV